MSLLAKIEQKIEKIRREPEHIRLRYIYGIIAVFMVFVVVLWFFSFFTNIKQDDAISKLNAQKIIDDFQAQKKSLQDIGNVTRNSINNLGNTSSQSDINTSTTPAN
jgi:hypothetical protein